MRHSTKLFLTTKFAKDTKGSGYFLIVNFVLFVTQRYPKTKTNMFVIESDDQAAILSVRSVASISTLSFW